MLKKLFAAALMSLFMVAGVQAEGSAARAMFTTDVQDREPVDEITSLTNANDQVYFYTDLRGLKGETVTHKWMHGGEVMAEVDFNVGGNRWRVWSSKNLVPTWTGEWTVKVVDSSGNELASKSMNYTDVSADMSSDM